MFYFLRKQGARISARKEINLFDAVWNEGKFPRGDEFFRRRKIYVIKQDDFVLKERGKPAYEKNNFFCDPCAVLKKPPTVDGENDFR